MLKLQLLRHGDQGSTRVNDILHQFPFSLPYSGYVSREAGATVNQGTYGFWWSQGSDSTVQARALGLDNNYTAPENINAKTLGLSVRYVTFFFFRKKLATKAPPASMIYSINSHSHCRIQATWTGLTVRFTLRVRTAASGQQALAPLPTPATCPSTVIIPTQRTRPIRPTAFLSAASFFYRAW